MKAAKFLAVLTAFGIFGSASVFAAAGSDCGDCSAVDCLTCGPVDIHKHKVYVNPHDLDNCNVRYCGKECETKKLTFGGLIQVDYDYVRTDDRAIGILVVGTDDAIIATRGTDVKDPFETGHFQMRRVRLGVDADLGNCWYGRVDLDLRAKCERECGQDTAFSTGSANSNNPNNFNQDLVGVDLTACESPCGDPITEQSLGDSVTSYVNGNACNQSLSNKFFTLNEAYIEKIYEGNSFKVGYKKVNFGAEENTHAAHLKAIERSIATNYFTGFMGRLPCRPDAQCGDSRIGVGNRHVGIFMDGEYHSFGYGLAVTNGFQGLGKSSKFANEIGLYGNLYYDTCITGFNVQLGVNVAYQPEGNTNWQRTQGRLVALSNQLGAGLLGNINHPVSPNRSSVIAWNPYVNLAWHDFTVMAEFLGARVQNGQINVSNQITSNATPLGYNILATYMYDENWELVGRYSSLDSDERGVRIANVVPDAQNVVGRLPAVPTNIFNESDAFYVGLNYYLKNKAVKFSVGYEHLAFKGRWGNTGFVPFAGGNPDFNTGEGKMFAGDKAKIDAVRARVQLVF